MQEKPESPFEQIYGLIDNYLGKEPIAEYAKKRKPRSFLPEEFDDSSLAVTEAIALIGGTRANLAMALGFSKASIDKALDINNEKARPELIAAFSRGRARMQSAISIRQMQKALEGDTTMLIHMGKVMLGQEHRPVYLDELEQNAGGAQEQQSTVKTLVLNIAQALNESYGTGNRNNNVS